MNALQWAQVIHLISHETKLHQISNQAPLEANLDPLLIETNLDLVPFNLSLLELNVG